MGSNLQTTEFDEWEEIAERVNQIDNDVTALVNLLRALADPDGAETERVREIRDEIEGRVAALFDELDGD